MHFHLCFWPTLLLLFALSAFAGISAVHAVVPGQIDTFQDGTTDNWKTGQIQPVNIANGGPGGAGDRFLELSSDGSGANGRLTVFNRNQWTGDYIAAGVNEITVDLNNFSDVTLNIRLAFKDSTTANGSGYVTSTAFTLTPSSGWQHAVFSITPTTMTAAGSPAPFSTFFSGPAEFRIINASTNTDLNGNAVVAQLGVDNIIAVPEPSSVVLVLGCSVGTMGLGVFRRRRIPSR